MQVIKRTFTYFIMFYEFSFNFIQLLRKKLFMWKEILINKTIVKQFYSLRRKSLVAYFKFANHCVKLSNKRGMKVMISNFFYTLGYFNKHNWYNEIKSFDLTDNNVIETWAQMISYKCYFKIVILKRARYELVKDCILNNCFKCNHH